MLSLHDSDNDDQAFAEHLEFIIAHFKPPAWPRTISTKTIQGRQILVYTKEEALARFKQSNYLDCRINAYSHYTEYKGINRQAPDFIFIDIDRSNFKTERALNLALNKTLKNIREIFNGDPTVLWSGNGYHIYQPIESFVLEQEETFATFDQPSKKFLKFAAQYLSNYKSDAKNNPSFKSCMIRIPGSYNSKCIEENRGSEVKIIQKWNGFKPKINLFLVRFYTYLIDQRIKELKKKKKKKNYKNNYYSQNTSNTIPWIEKLLETPLADHRKYVVWRILSPYLINVKQLSCEECFNIIKEWLIKCDQLERLNFNSSQKIREGINAATKKGYYPISLEKLKSENKELFDMLSF
jgi:Primase X